MFTKIPQGIFQFEIVPFFDNPKDLLVLKCIDKAHRDLFPKQADAIVKHFASEYDQVTQTLKDLQTEERVKAIDRSMKNMKKLKRGAWSELKVMASPPADAINTVVAVGTLISQDIKTDYQKAILMVRNTRFMRDISSINPDKIPKNVIQRVNRQLPFNGQNAARLARTSAVLPALANWARGVLDYANAHKDIVAPQKRFDELHTTLESLKKVRVNC